MAASAAPIGPNLFIADNAFTTEIIRKARASGAMVYVCAKDLKALAVCAGS
ncbi:MAG TPA: hypothetical protein VE085_15310 [Burkholderiales bacterium]|nr:hypothetical protein [Burkholderiales bacterium]